MQSVYLDALFVFDIKRSGCFHLRVVVQEEVPERVVDAATDTSFVMAIVGTHHVEAVYIASVMVE